MEQQKRSKLEIRQGIPQAHNTRHPTNGILLVYEVQSTNKRTNLNRNGPRPNYAGSDTTKKWDQTHDQHHNHRPRSYSIARHRSNRQLHFNRLCKLHTSPMQNETRAY